MRVIIVGGGLGGVTLAGALTARGIDFELIERASEFAPAGAGIALMFPALRIGEKLGISEVLEAASCDLPTMRWLYRSGAALQEFDYPTAWQGRQVRSIHRSRLHQALLASVPYERLSLAEAAYRICEADDGVEVQTERGRVLRGDLLVGADGIHSMVRQQVFAGERWRWKMPGCSQRNSQPPSWRKH